MATEEVRGLADNEYKCAQCGNVYVYGWTEEEALSERKDNGWDTLPDEDCAIVCDDCYKEIMREIN